MPTLKEVERAARSLAREGGRVSVRRVRARLPKGGSYSAEGPLLAQWKRDSGYRPAGMPAGVPPALTGATDVLMRGVWEAARAEAGRVLEEDRRKLGLLEEECLRQLEAAWAEVDRLEEEVAFLRGGAAAAPRAKVRGKPAEVEPKAAAFRGFVRGLMNRAAARDGGPVAEPAPVGTMRPDPELEALVGRCEAGFVPPAGPRLPPARPETTRRYWEAVVRDAADVIDGSGRPDLSVAEILSGLRVTERAGDPRFARLTEGLLRRKLTERSEAGKFVAKAEGGRFRARPGRQD